MLSDIPAMWRSQPQGVDFSRARWRFARAHGRPHGVPGRILGAREKSLQRQSGTSLDGTLTARKEFNRYSATFSEG